jgi:hypothetical protein
MTQQNVLLLKTSLQEATPDYSGDNRALEYCQSTEEKNFSYLAGYLQFTATFTPHANTQFIPR